MAFLSVQPFGPEPFGPEPFGPELTVEGLTVEGLTVEGLTVEGLTVEGLMAEGCSVFSAAFGHRNGQFDQKTDSSVVESDMSVQEEVMARHRPFSPER